MMKTNPGKKLVVLGGSLLLLLSTYTATALPSLQLDIIDGVYLGGTEQTIVTGSDDFTLVAYGLNGSVDLASDYYISIAITPQSGPTLVDFGSFVFGGVTYEMNDVVYGHPPIENTAFMQPKDAKDLSPHGVFPTLYAEFEFNFVSGQTAAAVNTQDVTGSDPTLNPGASLYYKLFDVDLSNLADGFGLHFDLYNTKVRTSSDIDIKDFAPFSHDAASSETREVPEPTTLMLLGLGMLILVTVSKGFRNLPVSS